MERIQNVNCKRRRFQGCNGCPLLEVMKGFYYCKRKAGHV